MKSPKSNKNSKRMSFLKFYVLTAVTAQSQFYLGSTLVPAEKTNEPSVAR